MLPLPDALPAQVPLVAYLAASSIYCAPTPSLQLFPLRLWTAIERRVAAGVAAVASVISVCHTDDELRAYS